MTAGAVLLGAVLLPGCGPETPDEYAEWSVTRSDEDLERTWRRLGQAGQVAMAQGLVGTGERRRVGWVVDRVLWDEDATALDALQDAEPGVVCAVLTDRAEAIDPDVDGAVVRHLAERCPVELGRVVRTRVASALRGDLELLDPVSRAVEGWTAAEPAALERVLDDLASGVDDPTTQRSGCEVAGLVLESSNDLVRSAAEARLHVFASDCLASANGTADILAFARVLQGRDGVDPVLLRDVQRRTSEFAAAQQEISELRAESASAEQLAKEAAAALQGSADMLEAEIDDSGAYRFTGWMVGELAPQSYEVATLTWNRFLGDVPSDDHRLLLTNDTVFTTTGRFTLWVEPAGTRQVTLTNGFTEYWKVMRERSDIPRLQSELRAIRSEYDEAYAKLQTIRRVTATLDEQERIARAPMDDAVDMLLASLQPEAEPVEEVEPALAAVEGIAPDESVDRTPVAAPMVARPATPSLRADATGAVDLGGTTAFTAQLSSATAPCEVRMRYVVDGDWAARQMSGPGDDGEYSLKLTIKDEMGDALRHYFEARCDNGTATAGTRSAPYSRSIL